MPHAVNFLALLTIFLFSNHPSFAQIDNSTNNNLTPYLKEAIEDYPNHFSNLQGRLVEENSQSSEYACNIKLPGTEYVSITRYSSKKLDSWSWQALVLTTEDFEEARNKFRALFGQLNKLAVKAVDGSPYYLEGRYELPREGKKFNNIIFTLNTSEVNFEKLRVEIVLVYEPMEWKVKVLIYGRERGDQEQGETVDG